MSTSSSGKLTRLAAAIPLEDDLHYVWRKALRGHELSVADLQTRWGVSAAEWDAILAGEWSKQAENLAAAWQLSPAALRHHSHYQPEVPHLTSVSRLQLPFENDTVNAWLIRDEDQTLLFDTGYGENDARALLNHIGAADLQLFLTHDHRDHVGHCQAPQRGQHRCGEQGAGRRSGGRGHGPVWPAQPLGLSPTRQAGGVAVIRRSVPCAACRARPCCRSPSG